MYPLICPAQDPSIKAAYQSKRVFGGEINLDAEQTTVHDLSDLGSYRADTLSGPGTMVFARTENS